MPVPDEIDADLLNTYQRGIPLESEPWAPFARRHGISEQEVVRRLQALQEGGFISRVGPMYDGKAMGGDTVLVALAVPEERFDEVTELVNSYPEVAHNYRRGHAYNMWFVATSDDPRATAAVIKEIGERSDLEPLVLPKLEEFFLGLYLEVQAP